MFETYKVGYRLWFTETAVIFNVERINSDKLNLREDCKL